MAEIPLQEEFEMAQKVYELYDNGKIEDAVNLTLSIENRASSYEDDYKRDLCLKYSAPCLIDIGYAAQQKEMIERGTKYLRVFLEKYGADDVSRVHEFYNIANGYFSAWKLDAASDLENGVDSESLRLSRHFYRQAIACLPSTHVRPDVACQVYTNYGNILAHIGRAIEALDAYDRALLLDPKMGMALGNKGVTLTELAPVTRGVVHVFYLEARRLLQLALKQRVTQEAGILFKRKLDQLNAVFAAHGESMSPEGLDNLKPQNDFHKFLCEFCARHGLFLSPATTLGESKEKYFGDPMFIGRMKISFEELDKADRYVTFLNEIKQEYVLGRYLLVQSQKSLPELDAVDEGVLLVYPLDYSLHSIYIQFLKAALKQAISVLDKVAYFLYDYCRMSTPKPNKVSFLQLWGGDDSLPEQLTGYNNPYLLALFYLARDVSKSGDWNFIYEHRHALTHRFLVLHDMDLGERQANRDIPRAREDVFTDQVIFATKIARAAVIYLILFVELEEQKLANADTGIRPTIYATTLDEGFRHRPRH